MKNQLKSPLANFSVLALSAECFDLELDGTLLQKETEEESSSCVSFITMSPLSGSYLADIMGCWLKSH